MRICTGKHRTARLQPAIWSPKSVLPGTQPIPDALKKPALADAGNAFSGVRAGGDSHVGVCYHERSTKLAKQASRLRGNRKTLWGDLAGTEANPGAEKKTGSGPDPADGIKPRFWPSIPKRSGPMGVGCFQSPVLPDPVGGYPPGLVVGMTFKCTSH